MTSRPCTRAMPPKVASPGSRPADCPARALPARVQQRRGRAGRGRRAAGVVRDARRASRSRRFSLRPRRHTTHTTATAQAARAASRSRPRVSSRRGAAGPAVEAGGGAADRGGDGEQAGGGVRGAQPGHQSASVPEAGPAQRGRAAVLVGLGVAVDRLLGLVVAPGAAGQVPQQAGQGGGHQGGEGEPAAGAAPPAAVRDGGREEAQPGVAVGARARCPRTARPPGRARPRRRPRRAAPSG